MTACLGNPCVLGHLIQLTHEGQHHQGAVWLVQDHPTNGLWPLQLKATSIWIGSLGLSRSPILIYLPHIHRHLRRFHKRHLWKKKKKEQDIRHWPRTQCKSKDQLNQAGEPSRWAQQVSRGLRGQEVKGAGGLRFPEPVSAPSPALSSRLWFTFGADLCPTSQPTHTSQTLHLALGWRHSHLLQLWRKDWPVVAPQGVSKGDLDFVFVLCTDWRTYLPS